MAKPKTVPLWAQKNSTSRVMPRKPDVIPNWARGLSEAIGKQVPTDPVSLALHRATRPRVQQERVPIASPPVLRPPVPHPFTQMQHEDAEAQRRRQYQNAAIRMHDVKIKVQEASRAALAAKTAKAESDAMLEIIEDNAAKIAKE